MITNSETSKETSKQVGAFNQLTAKIKEASNAVKLWAAEVKKLEGEIGTKSTELDKNIKEVEKTLKEGLEGAKKEVETLNKGLEDAKNELLSGIQAVQSRIDGFGNVSSDDFDELSVPSPLPNNSEVYSPMNLDSASGF